MLVLFYQTALRHIQKDSNVDDNITSHEMQEVPFHDNMSSTKYSNKGAVSLILAERSLSELGFVRGQKLQSAEYETLLLMGLQC